MERLSSRRVSFAVSLLTWTTKSNKMYVIALPILCDNFNKEIETSSKSEINFDFVAIAAVFLTEFKTILSLQMLMPFWMIQ